MQLLLETLIRLHIKEAFMLSDKDISGALNECEMASNISLVDEDPDFGGFTYENYLDECELAAVFPLISDKTFERLSSIKEDITITD
ncbi:MAG: hypothetical protein ABI091_23365 [Ferruginibacter sp.]